MYLVWACLLRSCPSWFNVKRNFTKKDLKNQIKKINCFLTISVIKQLNYIISPIKKEFSTKQLNGSN